jgi:hypothetical protein
MFHSIEPQDDASALRPHPNRLTLQGSVASAAFPPLCPNCGNAAANRIAVAKVFRQTDSDGPTRYTVVTADVPYCDPCIAAHRAQEEKPSLVETVLSAFSTMEMLGAVFPALGALFLAWLALGDLLHGRGTRFAIELAIGAAFALVAWLQGRAVWHETERFRVPPLSPVTEAFDFSDDAAPAFESARFVCTMRDPRFAAAFRALNAGQEWQAGSPRAVAERARSNRLLWIFGAAIAAFAIWQVLRDLFS